MPEISKEDYPALNIALGKALIASAWVDGELNEDEMACLKALVLQMPRISFEDWRRLKIYLAYPISAHEQKAIVEDLVDKVYTKGHQDFAGNALVEVLKADGVFTIEEKVFAHELQNSLKESSSRLKANISFSKLKLKTNRHGRDDSKDEINSSMNSLIIRFILFSEKLSWIKIL